MAAGTIISVLSKIPWGQVMDNAPKVAEGAARLWNTVTRRKPGPLPDSNATAVVEATQSDPEAVKQRLVAMQDHILRLEEQMSASAELIKALAEQNTQLVGRIELNSVRLRRLATAAAIVAVALSGAVVYLMLRA
jgi:hypothetical protein